MTLNPPKRVLRVLRCVRGTGAGGTSMAAQWNPFAVESRRMDVRTAGMLAIGAIALAGVTLLTGCSGVGAQANGAWAGCGNVARASAVQVRRTSMSQPPGVVGRSSVTQRHAAIVRRLYDDVCVLVAHPDHWPPDTAVVCPADFGLVYTGVFYAGNKRLAVMRYWASGCESLTLAAGSARASYGWFSRGATAAASRFGADFAAVLSIRSDARHWWP